MTCLDAAQGSSRQRADHDDAYPALARAPQEPVEVLGRKARWDGDARAGVEQVVADLRRVDRPGVDRPVQHGRLAERGDPAEPHLPLLAELLHGGHDLAQHVAEAQGAGTARRLDPIVELK